MGTIIIDKVNPGIEVARPLQAEKKQTEKKTTLARIEEAVKPNMGFNDLCLRYTAMMAIGITGGLIGNIGVTLAAVPFAFFGITGWCPINAILGRDTTLEKNEDH
jgi:hypothetical protein